MKNLVSENLRLLRYLSRWTLLAFVVAIGTSCSRQAGTVVDQATQRPIANATVYHNGKQVRSDAAGNFEFWKLDPLVPVLVKAPGYKAKSLKLGEKEPIRVELASFESKGVYMSRAGYGARVLREPLLTLLDETALNTLVIDLKDDRGLVSFNWTNALAAEIGVLTNTTIKDAKAFIKSMHERDIYVAGRIVVFKDTPLAKGHPEWAIRDRKTGQPWVDSEKLCWTDPFRHEVWNYNLELAEAAAKAGFDEIQFDYIRFPDSKAPNALEYACKNNEKARVGAINGFLEAAYTKLLPYNVYISADIFGRSLFNRSESGIGQELASLSAQVDYICPMVYPSGFGSNAFGLALYPTTVPYEVVTVALRRADYVFGDNYKKVRPWLQHFRDYAFDKRPFEVEQIRRQIQACNEIQTAGWMLWDPKNRYVHVRESLK